MDILIRQIKQLCLVSNQDADKIFQTFTFQNRACCEKYLKDNKDNSLHLAWKYARIFVRGHYLFLELHSRKTVRFSEQIMSADKYPCIFSSQMETISKHPESKYLIGIYFPGGYCTQIRPSEQDIVATCIYIKSVTWYHRISGLRRQLNYKLQYTVYSVYAQCAFLNIIHNYHVWMPFSPQSCTHAQG